MTGAGEAGLGIRHLRSKEIRQEIEITEQKQTIKALSEKLESQEKAIRQMGSQPANLGKADIKNIAEEVMARLDRELHMERQRRGLY
jgi:uncharacterized coiled-coil protein SlyX